MFSTHRDFNKCPLCGPVERQAFPQSARAPRVLQLLQWNDAPSDTELSGFQETVKTAPARLAELDEKIAHARRNLDVLTLERISIEADMEDAKALSSPVRRLPPDILRATCLHTIPSPFEIMSTLDSHGSLNHTMPPWTLSQSSMSLVLSNSFSSSIFFQIFMLGLRFERSQNAPLTVACFSTSDISSHPLLSLVITRISTIKNLRIDSPFQSLAALSFCRGRLELLHYLKTDTPKGSGGSFGAFSPVAERNIDALEYASNLRRFSVYGLLPHPLPVISWTQLTHFGLQIERMRELEVLRQATNLQDLEICTGASFTTGEEYTAVSLPFLTSLTLSSMRTSGTSPEIRFMFSLLSVPNLVDLHLIYAGKLVLPHIKAQNTITMLRITRLFITAGGSTDTYTFPGLLKLLNSVGNLQHLILRSSRALSSDDISLLNPSPTNAPLPHLKTLEVRSCTFNFDHSIFVGMVNTRRGGNDTKWDQLETDLVDDGLKIVYGD
ncbi:uncharacterized protein ARMOST_20527 [Armillaria ostoyae]|uniref:F-box domain-containing protein n=1 Tax=Armillaria ostoyae TaxID=47428 RepID=A0A284S7K6_ARMOS|nr:uncharacterized protein ARMOST_20527 [Armillaria ostoyae]